MPGLSDPYSMETLCPLCVSHAPNPFVVPSVTVCPLLQWPRRESPAGWRGSWRERGGLSLKTTWRCCSPQLFWTSYHRHRGEDAHSDIHSREQEPLKRLWCMFSLMGCFSYKHDILFVIHVQALCFGQLSTRDSAKECQGGFALPMFFCIQTRRHLETSS